MSKVTVFCGGLDSRTRDEDVKDAFSRYGRVEGVKMQNGFCFIEMESMQDANAAISGLDGSQLDGRQIKVEMGRRSDDRGGPREFDRPKGPRETGMNRVRIENLASNVSWQDLKDFARQAGNPIVSQVDKFTGVGIIEYANPEDVRSALRTLDGRDFNGSRVRIFEDRGGGSARGGGGGGRGYGGGGGGGGGYGRDEPRGAGYARGGYDDVRGGGGGPPRGYDDRDRYGGGGGGYGRGYGGGGGDYGPRGGYDDRGSYGGGGYAGGGPRGYDDRPQGGGGGWGGERGRVDDRDRYGGGGGGGGGYDRGGYDRGAPPPRDRSMPRGRY